MDLSSFTEASFGLRSARPQNTKRASQRSAARAYARGSAHTFRAGAECLQCVEWPSPAYARAVFHFDASSIVLATSRTSAAGPWHSLRAAAPAARTLFALASSVRQVESSCCLLICSLATVPT